MAEIPPLEAKTTSWIWAHQTRFDVDSAIYQQARQRFSDAKNLHTTSHLLAMSIVVILEHIPVIARVIETVRNCIYPVDDYIHGNVVLSEEEEPTAAAPAEPSPVKASYNSYLVDQLLQDKDLQNIVLDFGPLCEGNFKNLLFAIAVAQAKSTYPNWTLEHAYIFDDAKNVCEAATGLVGPGKAIQVPRGHQDTCLEDNLTEILRQVRDRGQPVLVCFDWGETLGGYGMLTDDSGQPIFEGDFPATGPIILGGQSVAGLIQQLQKAGCLIAWTTNDPNDAVGEIYNPVLARHQIRPFEILANGETGQVVRYELALRLLKIADPQGWKQKLETIKQQVRDYHMGDGKLPEGVSKEKFERMREIANQYASDLSSRDPKEKHHAQLALAIWNFKWDLSFERYTRYIDPNWQQS